METPEISSAGHDIPEKSAAGKHMPLIQEFRLQYDELTGRKSRLELPAPLSVCYAITNRCDKTCDHCMSGSTLRSAQGLPTEQVQQVFDVLKSAGVRRIDIVGGEPFLRKDIIELLSYATQVAGLEAVVTTHGGLLQKHHVEALARLPIVVQVSVDGPQEINDHLRGSGSFEGAAKAIDALVEADIPTRISSTIQRYNAPYLEEIVELAKKKGVKNIYINVVCAQGRADLLRDTICLSESELNDIHGRIEALRRHDKSYDDFIEMKRADRAGVFIDTNGNFISQGWATEDCERLGNVLSDDVKDMWKNTRVDHAAHLMQYLQHPLMYK